MRYSKQVFITIFFYFLILSTAYASGKVALVVKDVDSLSYVHEKNIQSILLQKGLDVFLIDKDNYASVDWNDFSLIVVAGRPGNVYGYQHLDDFVADLPVNDIPTIAIDSAYPDDWGWVKPGGMSTISSSREQKIRIVNENHPIIGNKIKNEIIVVHGIPGKSIIGLKESSHNLIPLASTNIHVRKIVIAYAEPNTTPFNNKAPIVFFGIPYSRYWTEDAEGLFTRSIDFLSSDEDEDGIADGIDNCPTVFNPDQQDFDGDGLGDMCDEDDDNDGVSDAYDFCQTEDATGYDNYIGQGNSAPGQDGCVDDVDEDFVKDNGDNCPSVYNPNQLDSDQDDIGDACDSCLNDAGNDVDGDGVCGDIDNCPNKYNPNQVDSDDNGIGDLCELLVYQVFLDVDVDGMNETAINENNVSDDGFEVYSDPNSNTKALAMDGDFDGMTDWLIDVGKNRIYDKYWDPDDGILTTVNRTDDTYEIDTNGDNETDLSYDVGEDAFVVNVDLDNDGFSEGAIDSDKDGSYDEYEDPDNSTLLLNIEDGDEDGRNDFVIGIQVNNTTEPSRYWDPDDGVVTEMVKFDVNNDGYLDYLVDVDGDGVFDKIYKKNTLYDLPDLVVESLSLSSSSPSVGDNVVITVIVRNGGEYNASNFSVVFRLDDNVVDSNSISLTSMSSDNVTFSWNNIVSGDHVINITVDESNVIFEQNESNNGWIRQVSVSTPSTGGSTTDKGGGAVRQGGRILPRGTLDFRGFPTKVELKQGESMTTEGRIENNLNYPLENVNISLVGDIPTDWYEIKPDGFDTLKKNTSEKIEISFSIPNNTQPKTHSLKITLNADSRYGKKTFSTDFDLVVKEVPVVGTTLESPTITTTTVEINETSGLPTGAFTTAISAAKSYWYVIGGILVLAILGGYWKYSGTEIKIEMEPEEPEEKPVIKKPKKEKPKVYEIEDEDLVDEKAEEVKSKVVEEIRERAKKEDEKLKGKKK